MAAGDRGCFSTCHHQAGTVRVSAGGFTVVEHPLFQQGLPHAHGVRTGEDTGALQHQPVHQLCAYTALSAGQGGGVT